jgi:predicted dehydrogenase
VDGVTIVACCDVERAVAEAWAREHGCERFYDDHLSMLREHELDAVLIATWPNFHQEQVLGCLDAGIRNILCEKALALTGPAALELWSEATAADALVVEAYMYRHHPAIGWIDELVAAGEIGALDSVSAAFNLFDPEEASPDDPTRDWRQRAECAGGVPFDLACYCVDACNRFARSRPRRAFAIGGTSTRYGTVDRLYGLVEYENGVVGLLESSKRSDASYELRLSGGNGSLRLPVAWMRDGPTEVVLSRSRGWAEFESQRIPVPSADSFRLQLERFAAAVQGVAPPIPTLAESVVTAFTLDALLASAAERAPVPVEIPEVIHA